MPSDEQGVDFSRYMLVPRTLIIITQGDKVLLIKGAHEKRLWAGLYNGIGGHIEKDEDILTSAYREFNEETGLSPEKIWLCGILTVDTKKNPGVCVFIFKGEFSGGNIKSSQEGNLEWISESSLGDIPLVADLPILLPKILNHKEDNKPFIAHSHYDEKEKLVVKFQ